MGAITNSDPFTSIITDPVTTMVTTAQGYANTANAQAQEAIDALKDSVTWDDTDQEEFEDNIEAMFNIGAGGLDGVGVVSASLKDSTPVVVADPDTVITSIDPLNSDDFDTGVIGTPPPFDAVKHSINIPDLPDDEFPTFTDDAPISPDINLPSKPSYTLPVIPTIEDVSIPSPPEYNIASFEGSMPVDDLTAPETMFYYNEAEYDSELANKLAANLLRELTTGGTGLDDETEQAIWDRATARQETENEQAYSEATEYFASRGFALPTGALNSSIMEVRAKIDQRNTDLNNDILVQQSKLAQENTHFAITQAISLERNLMDNANAVKNRAFETAKAVVELANAVYKIKLEKFIAQLEGYRVQASVFETKIRAEIAKAEFYKARIEGIKAGVDVKALLIQAYNSQIEGIKSLIQMYATEMEAAKIQADISRIGLDAYKTKAEVFATKTDALTSRYNAHASQIAGEAEKVKMYLGETQAYASKVDAFKMVADTAMVKAQIKLSEQQGRIDVLKVMLEKYNVESNRLIAEAELQFKSDGLDVEVFKADTDKYRTDIDALVKTYLGKVESAKAEAGILIEERKNAVQKLLGEKGLNVEAMSSLTKVSGQLAAAALTSISASTNLGMSKSENQTSSKGSTWSHDVTKDIHSHTHHYNE